MTSLPDPCVEEQGPGHTASSGLPLRLSRIRVSLRSVLVALVLAAVGATAALIHFSWSHAARENVVDVAVQLNQEIVGSVERELTGLLDSAAAVQEALRSIFAQGAVKPEDEAKREFIFLSLLRSQPALSWIAFGWPDGSFFGAQKIGEEGINMVEVRVDHEGSGAELRIDRYSQVPGDIIFLNRHFRLSNYRSTEQPWYRAATESDRPQWAMIRRFPNITRSALSISNRFEQYGRFIGVLDVVIDLDRLSHFLAGIKVGTNGTVALVDSLGRIVASADPKEPQAVAEGRTRTLAELSPADNPLLAAAAEILRKQPEGPLSLLAESGVTGEGLFVTRAPIAFSDWQVITVIPERDFLAGIERNTKHLLNALLLLTFIVAALAVLLLKRVVIDPLGRVTEQLAHVESFRPERLRQINSRLMEIASLSQALLSMGRGLTSFKRYLPAELVRTLVAQGIEARPGVTQRELTVLFADLAGFTSLSERLGDAVIPLLSDYLGQATRAVAAADGTIDKFIGDAVMAFWGAPVSDSQHALKACRAALDLQRRMLERRGLQADAASLSLRIGINSGRMLVGNVGSSDRLNYTVIGDAVNLASRLESLNKLYGTGIIVGPETRRLAGDAIVVRTLDEVAVYGRSATTPLYELIGLAEEAEALRSRDWVALYERALSAYRRRAWAEAIEGFAAAEALRGRTDGPSRLMIKRARAYREAPPGPDWLGATVLEMK